ncbi:hypothetical protein JCM11641_007029 [Rhodosporidiobolus odoratus]
MNPSDHSPTRPRPLTAHFATSTSAPSPSNTPLSPHRPTQTPKPVQVPRYGSQQLAFAAPLSIEPFRGQPHRVVPTPSLDLSANLKPLQPQQAAEKPLLGAREPSHGTLEEPSADQGGDRIAAFPLRNAQKGAEEKLAKRPRMKGKRAMVDEREEMAGLAKRQYPYAEGYPSCSNVGNGVLSCFPETNTTLTQGEYSKFIWNSRFPTFIGAGAVDVYLYNADTDDVAANWRNRTNANGMLSILPEDQWWASPTQSTDDWFGDAARNRTTPYYFVVVDGGTNLSGGEEHQATFDVVQTAAPTSLSSALAALTSSSMSSLSSASAASSASLASASASASSLSSLRSASSAGSLSDASGSGSATSRGGRNSGGDLQNSSSSGPAIPKWAIALIVIFGVLALVAGGFAVYFCLGRARKRRQADEAARRAQDMDDDDLTNGSRDPILGARGSVSGSAAHSAVAAGAAGPGAGALAAGVAGKEGEKREDDSTLSHTDAAKMAAAFRAALRKPEFPTGGSSPDESPGEPGLPPPVLAGAGAAGPGAGPSPRGARSGDVSEGSGERDAAGRALVEDELRSEGRSMKSVAGGGKRWGPSAV